MGKKEGRSYVGVFQRILLVYCRAETTRMSEELAEKVEALAWRFRGGTIGKEQMD